MKVLPRTWPSSFPPVLALGLLCTATPVHVQAASDATVAHLPAGGTLNIRAQPHLHAAIIAHLHNGDRVPLSSHACFDSVTGGATAAPRHTPNVWCEVVIEGDIIGYARAKYFDPLN